MIRKILLLLLYFAFAHFSRLTAQDADSILKDFLEKTGGQKKWQSVTSIRKIVKHLLVTDADTSRTTSEMCMTNHNLFYTKIEENGKVKRILYDGKKSWKINADNAPTDFPAIESMIKQGFLTFYGNSFLAIRLCDYDREGLTIQYQDKRTIGGKEYHILHIADNVHSMEVYFDAKTKLADYAYIGGNKIVYSEYKEIEGILFPIVISTYNNKGEQLVSTEKLVSIEINPKLPSYFFTLDYHTKK